MGPRGKGFMGQGLQGMEGFFHGRWVEGELGLRGSAGSGEECGAGEEHRCSRVGRRLTGEGWEP